MHSGFVNGDLAVIYQELSKNGLIFTARVKESLSESHTMEQVSSYQHNTISNVHLDKV